MSNPELTAVRDAHRFDEGALERYLTEHIDGFQGPMKIEQFEGGQSNPTFRLEAGGRRFVMRKQPPGKLLPSAHQVDREHRVMKAQQDTDVQSKPSHLVVGCTHACWYASLVSDTSFLRLPPRSLRNTTSFSQCVSANLAPWHLAFCSLARMNVARNLLSIER